MFSANNPLPANSLPQIIDDFNCKKIQIFFKYYYKMLLEICTKIQLRYIFFSFKSRYVQEMEAVIIMENVIQKLEFVSAMRDTMAKTVPVGISVFLFKIRIV